MPPRRVFVRNLVLTASIGLLPHEQSALQRIRLNIDLDVDDAGPPYSFSGVVDYARVADAARAIVASGHTRLVETLAERIAAACLKQARVLSARVMVEKLEVFADAESAGVEILRTR